MKLVVAEKPSVARDIARVLGVRAQGKGMFQGGDVVITWCIGHLVELAEPAAQDPAWKRWRLEALPMLPPRFALTPVKRTFEQWRVVAGLLRSGELESVVNACDAGREGELIFRYCLELSGARPRAVQRLWVSALTDAALRAGFANLRPGADFDALADAARCRSEADWLVGMNATRAVTVQAGGYGTILSIGRVQTPTLALLVAREKAIRDFVPETYAEVVGTFTTGPGARFRGLFTHEGKTRVPIEVGAKLAARDGAAGSARVVAALRKVEREPPPLLFDLTTLQKTANKLYRLSAKRTLETAQSLYERHKLLSYPRTDSRHLPETVRGELPGMLDAVATVPVYAPFAARARAASAARLPRMFDDRKVGEHHAIVPTDKTPNLDKLDADERKIYDLVVRRFLAAFYPDAEVEHTQVTVAVDAAAAEGLPPPPDLYVSKGHVRLVAGWQEVAGIEPRPEPLPAVVAGERVAGKYQKVEKQTEPPARYSEGSLLGAMESAGKSITDEALRLAMKDSGLGTPATRAQTIETLLERGYISRAGKELTPTQLGEELIDKLPVPSLASAELTGEWEARLARIARGEDTRAAFMKAIAGYVTDVVAAIRAAPPTRKSARAPVGKCPRCGGAVSDRYKFYGCAGCDFKLWKVIVGKSITPALAGVLLRNGRTLSLPGFRSKAGKRFSAAIVLDETGATKLDFDAPKPRTSRRPSMRKPRQVAQGARNLEPPF